jgi:AcrR family transcriptional regulator
MPSTKRVYRQTARATAAEELRQRVVTTFYKLLLPRWVDEITLDDVAASAGTTRQTVIRLFGGKEGLLKAIAAIVQAQAEPHISLPRNSSTERALQALIEHYEAVGDVIVRLLAQEERHPALRPILERGRSKHRAWVAKWFGSAMKGIERERQVTRLVVATDVYTWKLLRRDFGNTQKEVTLIMAGLLEQITGEKTK